MKYAIIKTGGKQIKVTVGMPIMVEKLEVEIGKTHDFTVVLAVYDGKELIIGTPYVENVVVKATPQKHGKGKKIKMNFALPSIFTYNANDFSNTVVDFSNTLPTFDDTTP